LEAVYNFTAAFSAIRIQYDYALNAMAQGMRGCGNADVERHSSLYDVTDGFYLWSDSSTVSAFGYNGSPGDPANFEENAQSDAVDKIVTLLYGHEYELCLGISASGFANQAICYGSAEMNNIRLDAVPIPPTVLMLGSGLAGLLGWRRKLFQG